LSGLAVVRRFIVRVVFQVHGQRVTGEVGQREVDDFGVAAAARIPDPVGAENTVGIRDSRVPLSGELDLNGDSCGPIVQDCSLAVRVRVAADPGGLSHGVGPTGEGPTGTQASRSAGPRGARGTWPPQLSSCPRRIPNFLGELGRNSLTGRRPVRPDPRGSTSASRGATVV